jgi:hypothetical protein
MQLTALFTLVVQTAPPFRPTDSLVVFVVSLLVGGLGIYAGGRLLAGNDDYGHAVVTAAIGALIWIVANALVGGIPLLGPILVAITYLAVIRWRYGVGWLTAGGVTLVAWLAALVVLALLASLGVGSFDAIGIPGT